MVFLENQIDDLEKEISVLLERTDSFITTITGIGDTLGAIILSEFGDIHRFNAPGKLVAFAGLDVKINQSVEFSDTKNKISKRGLLICIVLSGLPPDMPLFATLFRRLTTNRSE